MKVQANRIEAWLRAPPPSCRIALLYGPDRGLVTERAGHLVSLWADTDDPFNMVELDQESLRQEPSRLVDEALSIPLLGGRKVLRLRTPGAEADGPVADLLKLDAIEASVVIEAGDLPPRSKLRKMIDDHRSAASIPCYRDEGRAIQDLVRAVLNPAGVDLSADAMAYLVDNLGSDRGVSRAELEKLVTFAGDQRRLDTDDVAQIVGDSANIDIDRLITAVSVGDQIGLERALDRLLAANQQPIRLIRVISTHLMRLLELRSGVDAGSSVDTVIAQAKPPVHFRAKTMMRTALNGWNALALSRALAALLKAELQCKTGHPAAIVCRQVLVRVTMGARTKETAGSL
ncbi:MAG: DNA polymerase III subunit delta [Geminicoccaceae bacterium]